MAFDLSAPRGRGQHRARYRWVLLSNGALVVLLLGLTACTSPTPTESKKGADIVRDSFPEAKAAIRAEMLDLDDIVNRRDWDALRSAHLESSKFTKFGRGHERQGFDEMIGEEIAGASAVRDLSIDFRDLKIDVFGDVAVATSVPLFVMTNASGETVKIEVRGTMVWVKTADGWKIAHEHNSPLDSAK